MGEGESRARTAPGLTGNPGAKESSSGSRSLPLLLFWLVLFGPSCVLYGSRFSGSFPKLSDSVYPAMQWIAFLSKQDRVKAAFQDVVPRASRTLTAFSYAACLFFF